MTTFGMSISPELDPVIAPGERDIVLVRVFNAPRELVFRAWTDPAHLTQWWGPFEFSNPQCEIELRVGGRWRIVMRSPEGVDHPINGTIEELVPPERLVVMMDLDEEPAEWQAAVRGTHGLSADAPQNRVRTAVTFEEVDGLTRLTVRQTFGSTAERDAHEKLGSREGWGQSFDSLEELLLKGKA